MGPSTDATPTAVRDSSSLQFKRFYRFSVAAPFNVTETTSPENVPLPLIKEMTSLRKLQLFTPDPDGLLSSQMSMEPQGAHSVDAFVAVCPHLGEMLERRNSEESNGSGGGWKGKEKNECTLVINDNRNR